MERLHIAFFGPVNSGKSSLINAIAGQEVSLVSPVPGTTTDPVRKTIELPGLGACVLIDTAGLDDDSLLGDERERRTRSILNETDIAVVVSEVSQKEGHLYRNWGKNVLGVPDSGTPASLPVIYVASKTDLGGEIPEEAIPVSAVTGEGISALLEKIAEAAHREEGNWLTGDLVKAGDCVLLVMPQDNEAPKGRIILPQVQVLRELLDRGCVPVCCTPDSLKSAMESLGKAPNLVITDSQVFGLVNKALAPETRLTSFSILLAASKGDIRTYVEGAKAIDSLKPGDRVLIAEACTHVPDTEDIGRVKIPALLQRYVVAGGMGRKPVATLGRVRGRGPGVLVTEGELALKTGRESMGGAEASAKAVCDPIHTGNLTIDIAAGNDFPEDLSRYALIIHCGACVATRTLVRSRIRKALLAGVPITNYGIALAKLQGILDRIVLP